MDKDDLLLLPNGTVTAIPTKVRLQSGSILPNLPVYLSKKNTGLLGKLLKNVSGKEWLAISN